MTNFYDPYGRRRRTVTTQRQDPPSSYAQETGRSGPTLEDYKKLRLEHQKLQAHVEQQNKELAAANQELDIKTEALQRQTADLKDLEAELVWTKAALQKYEEESNDAEGQSWQERYVRLQAEIENLRKRWEQRYKQEVAEARHEILRDMLPLADHLELALRHGENLDDETEQNFVRNIEATRQAFMDTLKRYNVQPIDAVGEPFDPNLHEAVGQLQNTGTDADTVVQVVQTGYVDGDKLLRPARVLVSSA